MPNQYINKVVYGGSPLIDLTSDTAVASDVAAGKYFHLATGERVEGTASGGGTGGNVWQDAQGYVHLDDEGGGSSVDVEPLSVTQNGTYTAPAGTAYSPVTVNVSGGGDLKSLVDGTATALTLPSGLTEIRPYCFYDFDSLISVLLPSGLQDIGERAFYSCSNLINVSLPDSVTSLGEYAFYNCSTAEISSLPSGLTSLGQYAFSGCYAATFSSLPSGLTTIPLQAFYRCRNIEVSLLPSSITAIGQYAFQGCGKITSITCEAAITSIGTYAFNGFSSTGEASVLESALFPNANITNLSYAFGNSSSASNACQELELVDAGSVATIAANAFANCYKLQTLVLRKTASNTALSNVSAFTNTPMRGYNGLTGTVYVPSALISAYQTATNWSTLYNAGTVQFVAIEGSEYER